MCVCGVYVDHIYPTDCLYYRRPHYANSKRLIGCLETQLNNSWALAALLWPTYAKQPEQQQSPWPLWLAGCIHWIIFVKYIRIRTSTHTHTRTAYFPHIFAQSTGPWHQAQKLHHTQNHHHWWKILTKHKYAVWTISQLLPILGQEDAKDNNRTAPFERPQRTCPLCSAHNQHDIYFYSHLERLCNKQLLFIRMCSRTSYTPFLLNNNTIRPDRYHINIEHHGRQYYIKLEIKYVVMSLPW